MAPIPAHEATTSYDCRVPGCTGESKLNRGLYAYLCDDHRRQKVDREREARSSGAPREARAPAASSGVSFEQVAKQLVPLGRKVDRAYVAADRAKAACKPTLEKAQTAKTAAEAVRAEFFAAVRALLDERPGT